MTQPPQHLIPRDSARQRWWIDTTRKREAPSTAGGSRGPTRSLRSALEVAYRPPLLDGRRLNVEWHSYRKTYRHSHFLIPRFLARVPLGHTLPIYARAVSRQAAWQLHAPPRPSRACQPVVETLSELHPNCSGSSHVPLLPLGLRLFRLFHSHFVKKNGALGLKKKTKCENKRRYRGSPLLFLLI